MSIRKMFGLAAFAFIAVAACSSTAFAGEEVPEIDPSSIASALTLLSGGFLVLTGRRRAK